MSAGAEGALIGGQPSTAAHFRDAGAADDTLACPRNAEDSRATEQSVTHVTARLAETLAHDALDRAELEGWA